MSRLSDAQRRALEMLLEDEVWVTQDPEVERSIRPQTLAALQRRGLVLQEVHVRGEPRAAWLHDAEEHERARELLEDA